MQQDDNGSILRPRGRGVKTQVPVLKIKSCVQNSSLFVTLGVESKIFRCKVDNALSPFLKAAWQRARFFHFYLIENPPEVLRVVVEPQHISPKLVCAFYGITRTVYDLGTNISCAPIESFVDTQFLCTEFAKRRLDVFRNFPVVYFLEPCQSPK